MTPAQQRLDRLWDAHVRHEFVDRGTVAHEHIYWDQASVLAQLGLLDPTDLPVAGVETARKVREG